MEISSILTLRFPKNEAPECDRDVPLKKSKLPEYLWLEFNNHIAGVFKRVGEGKIYNLVEQISKESASERGIDCY